MSSFFSSCFSSYYASASSAVAAMLTPEFWLALWPQWKTAILSCGGILLFPNTYTDIKQIDAKPYTVNEAEQAQIQRNVYNYFGVNEDVLQNKAMGDALDAFFNGAIEPFEIQLSEVMTKMTFTRREIAQGTEIRVTSNRLQYMPVSTKISMVQQLGDRGMITIDEARALFNYEPLPDGTGQAAPIRGEYYNAGEKIVPEKTETE